MRSVRSGAELRIQFARAAEEGEKQWCAGHAPELLTLKMGRVRVVWAASSQVCRSRRLVCVRERISAVPARLARISTFMHDMCARRLQLQVALWHDASRITFDPWSRPFPAARCPIRSDDLEKCSYWGSKLWHGPGTECRLVVRPISDPYRFRTASARYSRSESRSDQWSGGKLGPEDPGRSGLNFDFDFT